MTGFRQALTGYRYNAADTFTKGIRTAASKSTISFTASVQPMGAKDMLALPEGRRDREAFRLYTDFELKTSDESTLVNADQVTVRGHLYEVISVEIWQNNVIPYYKAIVSRLNV